MFSAKLPQKNKNFKKFHEFLVEPKNKLVYEVITGLLHEPETPCYSPVVLFGPSGCGKTHLLESLVLELQKKHHSDVLFFNAQEFYRSYSASLRRNEFQTFRERCRNCRIFILDDLQSLQKKKQTQNELLFTLNEILSKNSLVVIGSQTKLKNLDDFNPALINRLESGLHIPMHPVSNQAAIDYLKNMAQNLSFHIPDKILERLLSDYHVSFGDLKDNFRKLLLFCASNQERISKPLLSGFMQRYYETRKVLNKEIIIEIVAKHYRIENPQELLQKNGKKSQKEARYIAIALAKNLLQKTNCELQNEFGLSESSVRYALKKIHSDPVLQNILIKLKQDLEC